MEYLILALGAFAAGLVDAVVGGGGLIQLPILFLGFPQASVPLVFGTNKVASISGTASAVWQYARRVKFDKRIIYPTTIAALIGSAVGASVVSLLPKSAVMPLVIILLIGTGLYTLFKPDFGTTHTEPLIKKNIPMGGTVMGSILGFYDGFFGPGTGSFIIFGFVRFFGMDMLNASASAKVINLATNFAALSVFLLHGGVMWKIGLMMAVCNILGAQCGVRLALKNGNKFIRYFLLIMVAILTVKLGRDYWASFY